MRIPLPILGALVVALAAVYLVTVHTQAAATVVNATALAVGENVTMTFDYVPDTITLYLDNSGIYSITLQVPGADFAVNDTLAHEVFSTTIRGLSVAELNIEVVRATLGKPSLTVVVVRTGTIG